MNSIISFEFNHSSICVIDKIGEPWLVAKDIADVLQFSEASVMTRHI
ncbi:BRO family protein [Spartinivicinus poritis]|uniref:BRO family protein n=1 Tax=Spartinivicinus poritis TaxID=2994640 RepID=A0ABT5UIF3_9GAMM|nr:BRO family protein [Spartinivicinus sp. A2-2]MDE1465766.1 BRO family protein [Spartinivicinus sp. A2-2]